MSKRYRPLGLFVALAAECSIPPVAQNLSIHALAHARPEAGAATPDHLGWKAYSWPGIFYLNGPESIESRASTRGPLHLNMLAHDRHGCDLGPAPPAGQCQIVYLYHTVTRDDVTTLTQPNSTRPIHP
jgi:hypothetical protein